MKNTNLEKLDAARYEVREATLAQEGFLDLFKKIIPESIRSFISFNKDTNWKKLEVENKNPNLTKCISVLNKSNYLDYMDLEISVPEGFQGNLYEYSVILLDAAQLCAGLPAELETFTAYAGGLVGSANAGLTIKSNEFLYKGREEQRAKALANIGSKFSSKRNVVLPFNLTFKNNGQAVDAINNILHAQDILMGIDRTELRKNIGNCSVILNELLVMIKEDKIKNISSKVPKEISEGTFAIASDIEFYGMLTHQVNTMVVIFDRNTARLTAAGA
jgi:hypothetical protein